MQTLTGAVETLQDAVLLFEACREGYLPRVQRRLNESEKRARIRSGAIFVWDEEEAAIKRWTDSRLWSPSRRFQERFLTYYEIEGKEATATQVEARPVVNRDPFVAPSSGPVVRKPGGLSKRCLSVRTSNGRKLHLVAYYLEADLNEGKLLRPHQQQALAGLTERLLTYEAFRRYPDLWQAWLDPKNADRAARARGGPISPNAGLETARESVEYDNTAAAVVGAAQQRDYPRQQYYPAAGFPFPTGPWTPANVAAPDGYRDASYPPPPSARYAGGQGMHAHTQRGPDPVMMRGPPAQPGDGVHHPHHRYDHARPVRAPHYAHPHAEQQAAYWRPPHHHHRPGPCNEPCCVGQDTSMLAAHRSAGQLDMSIPDAGGEVLSTGAGKAHIPSNFTPAYVAYPNMRGIAQTAAGGSNGDRRSSTSRLPQQHPIARFADNPYARRTSTSSASTATPPPFLVHSAASSNTSVGTAPHDALVPHGTPNLSVDPALLTGNGKKAVTSPPRVANVSKAETRPEFSPADAPRRLSITGLS
ncbi:Gti1/Pac2 family-domain-containing protein [Fimicolochytrium jonesii]|uniref:Gti1/Pac2 family-domain-containing protein n=1 Tax=Fimicolochytrium jonesii TaxID=1396493 RepID=UPI0022FDE61B|nr:Gti1/Pac2 family-domain-containing protein [Fimicolochytrium jonesii]KAI8824163.1 Gti1/Pac2 family-domain-containing protein [Fimicolochytrium jonesii]